MNADSVDHCRLHVCGINEEQITHIQIRLSRSRKLLFIYYFGNAKAVDSRQCGRCEYIYGLRKLIKTKFSVFRNGHARFSFFSLLFFWRSVNYYAQNRLRWSIKFRSSHCSRQTQKYAIEFGVDPFVHSWAQFHVTAIINMLFAKLHKHEQQKISVWLFYERNILWSCHTFAPFAQTKSNQETKSTPFSFFLCVVLRAIPTSTGCVYHSCVTSVCNCMYMFVCVCLCVKYDNFMMHIITAI